MLKLLGAIMIVGSCTLIGLSTNRRLHNRVLVLQEWLSILQEIKSEIVFRSAPITDIMRRFAEKENYFTSKYFQSIYSNLELFGLQTAAEQSKGKLEELPLTENDLIELNHIFDVIGRYDILTQTEALSRVIMSMEEQLQDAKLQYGQKGKLYQAVGLSCGIALALIAS